MNRRLDSQDLERFEGLTYDAFRALAVDESSSRYERIGFPDSYRDGAEPAILADIVAKLPGRFPGATPIGDLGKFDAVLAYGVLHSPC